MLQRWGTKRLDSGQKERNLSPSIVTSKPSRVFKCQVTHHRIAGSLTTEAESLNDWPDDADDLGWIELIVGNAYGGPSCLGFIITTLSSSLSE